MCSFPHALAPTGVGVCVFCLSVSAMGAMTGTGKLSARQPPLFEMSIVN